MTNADQFKINLNQNLWGLVLAFGSLGAAERFNLTTLYKVRCCYGHGHEHIGCRNYVFLYREVLQEQMERLKLRFLRSAK